MRRLHLLLLTLCLPFSGAVRAAMHEGDGLAEFPGQRGGDVGFSALERERGYAALFEGDASPLLRVPFQSFGGGETGLSYGPLLRYRDSDTFDLAGPDTLEAGGFLSWRYGPWQLQGSALGGNPLNGDAGLLGFSGSYALRGGERLTLTFSGSASYASDDYLRQRALTDPYLEGVTPEGRGVSNLGLGLNASYRLGTDWSLIGMFGVHHTLSEGALSGAEDGTRFRAGAALSLDF